MRLLWLASIFTLAVSMGVVDAAPTPTHPALPPPITTRQTLFSIPFQIERVEHPSQKAAEVQLYVSTDRGARWQVYQRVPPENGHFLFRAVTDGEYWFLIRTLDRSGQIRPQRAEPGLRVFVDTTLPELAIEAQRGAAGEIVVRWRVVEPHLDLGSLKIQYRTGAGVPWESVAIDRQKISPSGPDRTGEVTWWPTAGGEVVEIRAEVADTAGNSAVSHAKVKLDRLASTGAEPATGSQQDVSAGAAIAGMPPPPAEPPQGASRWQGDPPTAETAARQPGADERSSPEVGRYGRRKQAKVAANAPKANGASAWPPSSSVAAPANPLVGSRYDLPQQDMVDTMGAPTAPGNSPKMVNSRLFELEYEVDAVALSGGQRVELWGTRDGGLSWSNFGADRDKQSPMLVTVNEEGVYGFRVVVQDASLRDQQPQRGDMPDVWIGVDLTKPSARITSVQRGTGNEAGQMIVEWETEDQMLADRPVTLLASGNAGGPWSMIASGLDGTGRYAWAINDRFPQRVHVRMEVRDTAGNVCIVETAEARGLETAEAGGFTSPRPAVRIQDVRPLVGTGERSGAW